MLNSFVRLVRVDPGFPSDQLLTIGFHLQHPKYMEFDGSQYLIRFTPGAAVVQQHLLERIETLPEVDSVGLISAASPRAPVSILGRPAAARTEPFQAAYMETSPDYFRTLQIPLLKGRVFTARDGAGAPSSCIRRLRLSTGYRCLTEDVSIRASAPCGWSRPPPSGSR